MIITTASKERETEVLKFLTEFKKEEIYLFVEPQEFEKYTNMYPQVTVVNIQKSNLGFSYLMDFINKYVLNVLKQKYYFFLDDDIKGFEKRNEENKLRKIKDNKEIKDMFDIIDLFISSENISQVGLSFNVHNRFCEEDIEYDKGSWCALCNNAEDIEAIGGYELGIKIFSDWEISARLISKEYKTAVLYKYAFNHQMKSAKGGAEFIYKDNSIVDNACKFLREKYGDVCEIKFNESHQMNEIRFKWKALRTQSNKLINKKLLKD
jgi:hypothetical protein